MYNINQNNRIEIENEFMALLVNKNEMLDLIQVKPKYLGQQKNRILLEQLLYCWKEHGVINLMKIVEKYNNFNTDWYFELLNNVFWHKYASNRQLEIAEESIVKFYKEEIIKKINYKLQNNQITYDDFMRKMKILDDIKIKKGANLLTQEELEKNIVDQKQIKFKKFRRLEKILKLAQNDLVVIGSMTGTGKTGFMLNIMNDLMENYQCIYFNMEMSKSSIYKRMIAINSNVPVDYINEPSKYQKELISESMKKIENCKIIIEHQMSDIFNIKSFVRKCKEVGRHTIIFIDHLGLVKVSGKNNLYEQMTEIIKVLRQICLEFDCTIIGASQLNRSAYSSSELSLSMLKDSGELENSARKVILLYRSKDSPKEDSEPMMEVEICKNDSGSTGSLRMKYYKTKQIFEEERNW